MRTKVRLERIAEERRVFQLEFDDGLSNLLRHLLGERSSFGGSGPPGRWPQMGQFWRRYPSPEHRGPFSAFLT